MAQSMLRTDENDIIKRKIRKRYVEIASSVDPTGTVVSEMISKGVVTFDKASNIYKLKTNSERIFELIGKVFQGGHPRAFIVFKEALAHEYPWMVQMIDGTEITQEVTSGEDMEKNKALQKAVQTCLKDINASIDPKGSIMDLLYQEHAITWRNMVELMGLAHQDDRIKALIPMLNDSANKKAYIIFLESLEKEYEWIVSDINKAVGCGESLR